MKLRYIGGHTAIDVPLGPFEMLTVRKGGDAEIPDNIAAGLLEQTGNWEAVEEEVAPAGRRAPKAAAAEEPAAEPAQTEEG